MRQYGTPALALLACCFVPWKPLIGLSLSKDQYSHIVLTPFIAAGLLWFGKDRIFRSGSGRALWAIPMIIFGLVLRNIERLVPSLSRSPYLLSVSTFGALVIVVAVFLLRFGYGAFRRASFALGFLVLMVPIPERLMLLLIVGLQHGSAAFSAILFKLIHLPVLRNGMRFSLPGFDIEIAEQCSGVRSSLALCIATALAGHLFLHTMWRRLLLVALTIPLVIFKNALRIVTISSLGVYISQDFLHGALHRYSGLPFSLVEVGIVAPLLIRWHRLEKYWFARQTEIDAAKA